MNKVTQSIYKNKVDKLEERGSGGATLDNIVDSQNHKRFIEGNGTPESISGMTVLYCKWSLSGTHLMLVLSGTFAQDTGIRLNTIFAKFYLPDWIMNKIIAPFSDNIIEYKNHQLRNSTGGGIKTFTVKLEKGSNYLSFDTNTSDTLTESVFRFQFDLLIDSE